MLILILIHCSVKNQAPTDPTFSENGVRIFLVHRLLHGKKRRARCLTGLNNVLLPTLFTLVNNIEQYCIVEHESGVTILFNIVGNCEQCGQQSIVQSCFPQYCNNLSVFTRVVTVGFFSSMALPLANSCNELNNFKQKCLFQPFRLIQIYEGVVSPFFNVYCITYNFECGKQASRLVTPCC